MDIQPTDIEHVRQVDTNLGKLSEETGARIRAARSAQGLRIKDVTDASGLTHARVSDLENGHSVISLDHMEKFAAALGTAPGALLASSPAPHM